MTLYTRHKLSPSLLWHFSLLAQLTNEYYIAKQRARELQQMSYLRAVHETGARLTHDVKNLLQSLNNLCFMAQTPDGLDGSGLAQLMQRQLPQITQRLQQNAREAAGATGRAGGRGRLRLTSGGACYNSVMRMIWWSSMPSISPARRAYRLLYLTAWRITCCRMHSSNGRAKAAWRSM